MNQSSYLKHFATAKIVDCISCGLGQFVVAGRVGCMSLQGRPEMAAVAEGRIRQGMGLS